MKFYKDKFIFLPVITIVASLIYLIYISYFASIHTELTYGEFLKNVQSSSVKSVILDDTPKMKISLNTGENYVVENPKSNSLKEELLKNNIKVTESTAPPLDKTIPSLLIIVSTFAILYKTVIKKKVKSSSFSSLNPEDFSENNRTTLDFDSLAGNEEAKESVKDIVDFLKFPHKYEKYGARMPKGIILYGEPGTGKTMLAKAVAGEAGVPFYAVSGSDFIQMYVGVGAARIRDLFKKAKSKGRAVIFIDEIDAIGKSRDSNKAGGSDERDQTLNALLTQMSGFSEKDGIIVMAATNRLDILDSALLRPGRFDRHIEVALPDLSARERIISLHLKNKPHKELDIEALAHKTAFFSGAKLENLINEAAILAAKERCEWITNLHLDKAFSTVIAGQEKIDRTSFNLDDLKITAYHEAGHALVSKIVLPKETISKVTIIPTSKGAGGYTLTIPHNTSYKTIDYLKRRIMVLLGGRAAEEIIFGENGITTGAYSDISRSTDIILNMITEYGMGSSLGLLKMSNLKNLSQSLSLKATEECKHIVDNLYSDTKKLLLNNLSILHSISNELLAKETLSTDEISCLCENIE